MASLVEVEHTGLYGLWAEILVEIDGVFGAVTII